jgi:hypothetical protein
VTLLVPVLQHNNKMVFVRMAARVLIFALVIAFTLLETHCTIAAASFAIIGKSLRNPPSRDLSYQERSRHPCSLRSNSGKWSSILRGSTQGDDKFGFRQRFASIQCLLLGAFVGSIAQAPVSLLHDTFFHGGGLAQWEYDTDMAAITGGLFAIVYRYCIREDTGNPQLNQGVISALVLTRTLPQVKIPSYCQAIPLNCADAPLYILDGNVLQQLAWGGLESTCLFAGTAMAMDMAMEKGYIIRFPG